MSIPYERWFDAIQVRTSRRKFTSDPVDKGALERIQVLADMLQRDWPNARVVVHKTGFSKVVKTMVGSYGIITGAESYATVIAGKKDEVDYVHAGYLGEAVVLEAKSNGLDTCWVGGFFDPARAKQELTMSPKEQIVAVIPIGYAPKDFTLTERIVKGIAKSANRKSLEDLCIGRPLEEVPKWMQQAVKAARLAPSAVNRQPWQFDLGKEQIILHCTLSPKRGQTPYLDCGIALLHLVVAARKENAKMQVELMKPPAVARVFPSE